MDGSISFHSQEISFRLAHPIKTQNWIRAVVSMEKRPIDEIHYIFCSDDYLRNLNKSFLDHDYYTDILTFDYSESKALCGDIYISIDRIKDNAASFGESFERELRRVMIHGVLHLLGYIDHSASEKAAMHKKEEACLSLYRG